MARVDEGLRVGNRRTDEGRLREDQVHHVDAARIRARVNSSNRLVQQQEEKANEARQRIVRAEALRALVVVVDDGLEGQRASEEHGVGNAANPRQRPQQIFVLGLDQFHG